MTGQQLTTRRLVLRRFTAQDADALYDILSDEQVVAFEPYRVLSRRECADEAVRRQPQ